MTTTRRVSASATAASAAADRPVVRRPVSKSVPRSRPAEADVSTLLRFVLLSMALHALVILVFGTASTGGGGGRRGEGAAGPLEVTLRALGVEPGPGFRVAPGMVARPPGEALRRRSTGEVPAPSAPPAPRPDDARPTPAAPAPGDRATVDRPGPGDASR